MIKNRPMFFLIIIAALFAGCTPSLPAIKKINFSDYQTGKVTYSPYNGTPGTVNQIRTTENAQEVAPKESNSPKEKFYIKVNSQILTWKEYIRSRFPDKKVVFPDELPPPAKRIEYRIGVDDVLHVSVWEHADLTLDIAVRKDGLISFPLVGNVQAQGLTIPELEDKLQKGLARFLQNPQVTINTKEVLSVRIFIIGQVRKLNVTSTGGIRPDFLLRGGGTLLDALSDVEPAADADLAATYVTRDDLVIPVNLKALLRYGDLSQNIQLQPNDRLVIPGPTKEVTILGEVFAQDRYKVFIDTSLSDILSLAKGTKKDSADLYMAYIARNREILPVNIKRLLDYGDLGQNMLMEDGDLLYVPNINEKKYYVVGEVNSPKVVQFTDPQTIIEAITQAGGFNYYANRQQVVVVRGDIRNPQIYEINALALMEGKSLEKFTLAKGDIVYIPRTYIADWNIFINQVLPTLSTAGLIAVLAQ
jgi:polysaccharide biosynthesis/export protein